MNAANTVRRFALAARLAADEPVRLPPGAAGRRTAQYRRFLAFCVHLQRLAGARRAAAIHPGRVGRAIGSSAGTVSAFRAWALRDGHLAPSPGGGPDEFLVAVTRFRC